MYITLLGEKLYLADTVAVVQKALSDGSYTLTEDVDEAAARIRARFAKTKDADVFIATLENAVKTGAVEWARWGLEAIGYSEDEARETAQVYADAIKRRKELVEGAFKVIAAREKK